MNLKNILSNDNMIKNLKNLKKIGTLMYWEHFVIELMKDEINDQFYIKSWSNQITKNNKSYQFDLIYNIAKDQIIQLLEGKITLKNAIEKNSKVYIMQSQIYYNNEIEEIYKKKKLEITAETLKSFFTNNKNNNMFFELIPDDLKELGLMPNENARIELFDDLSLNLSVILIKKLKENNLKFTNDFYLNKIKSIKNRDGVDLYIKNSLIHYISRKPTFEYEKLFKISDFLEKLFNEIEVLDKNFYENFDLDFHLNGKNIFIIQKEFAFSFNKLVIFISKKSIKYSLVLNEDVFEDRILFNEAIPEKLLNFINIEQRS